MFTVTLFTIVKIHNQSGCSPTDNKENAVNTHDRLVGYKEWIYVIFQKINGTEGRRAKQNVSNPERQILHIFFHMTNAAVKKRTGKNGDY